jgi:hypothetical protein
MELVIRSTGRKIFFMVGVLVFKNREEWDRGSDLFMVKGGAPVHTPPAAVCASGIGKNILLHGLCERNHVRGSN